MARIPAAGAMAVIPPQRNRTDQRDDARPMYHDRTLVARFFTRLQQFRRRATRDDTLVRTFMSLRNLVCAYLGLA